MDTSVDSGISESAKFLITGGCGFIGTALVKNLVAQGSHHIRILDNLTVGTREDLGRVCNFVEVDLPSPKQPQRPNCAPAPPGFAHSDFGHSNSFRISDFEFRASPAGVHLIVGDILDYDLALRAAAGVDVIVHLAANTGVEPSVKDPRMDCVTNVIGTLNYLEAARHNRVRRFVFASSGAPVGEVEPPIHEELPPHPVSPYGAGKLAGEAYCSAYHKTFGIETVALRFGNVYGPGSSHKNSVVAKFIRQALAGDILTIYGDGQQTRDFIFIDDLIHAIRCAAFTPGIGGEIFQIATSKETTINELVETLVPILKGAGIQDIQVKYASPRAGDVKRNYSDTSKARQKLGWQARMTLKQGLEKTVQWFITPPRLTSHV